MLYAVPVEAFPVVWERPEELCAVLHSRTPVRLNPVVVLYYNSHTRQFGVATAKDRTPRCF